MFRKQVRKTTKPPPTSDEKNGFWREQWALKSWNRILWGALCKKNTDKRNMKHVHQQNTQNTAATSRWGHAHFMGKYNKYDRFLFEMILVVVLTVIRTKITNRERLAISPSTTRFIFIAGCIPKNDTIEESHTMHANVTTPRARCCMGSRLMFVHFGSDTVEQNVCMFICLQVTKTTGILLESSVWWCLTKGFSCFAAQFSSIFAFCSAWHPPRVQVVLLRTSPLFQTAPNKTSKTKWTQPHKVCFKRLPSWGILVES